MAAVRVQLRRAAVSSARQSSMTSAALDLSAEQPQRSCVALRLHAEHETTVRVLMVALNVTVAVARVAVLPSRLDFGEVLMGELPQLRSATLELVNAAPHGVRLTGVHLREPNPAVSLTVLLERSAVVSPGASVTAVQVAVRVDKVNHLTEGAVVLVVQSEADTAPPRFMEVAYAFHYVTGRLTASPTALSLHPRTLSRLSLCDGQCSWCTCVVETVGAGVVLHHCAALASALSSVPSATVELRNTLADRTLFVLALTVDDAALAIVPAATLPGALTDCAE